MIVIDFIVLIVCIEGVTVNAFVVVRCRRALLQWVIFCT